MRLQVCTSCGERFADQHEKKLCDDCDVAKMLPKVILKQPNERNFESKRRERGKQRRKKLDKYALNP